MSHNVEGKDTPGRGKTEVIFVGFKGEPCGL
jgi:hypothetical protein